MPNDYIGAISAEPKDAKHVGVKGMRWGIHRSRSAKAAAAKKTASGDTAKKGSSTTSTTKSGSNIQDHVESSPARYARLASEAKAGHASKMTEQDLKFFNARTDALAKINKLNEQDQSWLAKTAKTVLQTSAQRQMQSLSDTLADKYIGSPLKDALTDNSAAVKAETKTPIDYIGRHRAKKK